MFAFGRKAKIDRIYALLNEQFSAISTSPAEELVERRDLEEVFDLSRSIETTVELVLLRQQAVIAEGFKDRANFETMAEEMIEHAKKSGEAPEQFVQNEADAQVASAKAYVDRLTDLLDTGQIVANSNVRNYCAENAVAMVAAWQTYRARLLTAAEQLLAKCAT